MVEKAELEREPLTGLTILCMKQGLDPTGDKETLIARLLGKEKPEPETKPELKDETEPETPETAGVSTEGVAEEEAPEVVVEVTAPPGSED